MPDPEIRRQGRDQGDQRTVIIVGIAMQSSELIPHLFRTEYSKIIAVLCKLYGLEHIEIAEDIASDTFLTASEVWALKGVPANPAAWLYTVAKNKTKDHFKHLAVFDTKVKEAIKPDVATTPPDFEFSHQHIADSQLAMIFACCNPANSPESQICLALQILCGFSVEEIANALLAQKETIKKRLQRGRANLRNDNFQIKPLSNTCLQSRLDTVLTTLYLLFNEGYFSTSGNRLIRKELCLEAIRLTGLLTENPLTNLPKTNALLALLYFQSSRLDARTNEQGEAILLDQQDKSLWDQQHIDKGRHYLIIACTGNELSKYHLEAGIAYWHTAQINEEEKWQQILQLYNQLIVIEYSPVTALNRTFAFAKVYGHEQGIAEAEKLPLTQLSDYHALLGYLYAGIDPEKAIGHYQQAIGLTGSSVEKQTLMNEVKRLGG